MTMDPATAASVEHQARTYYFCRKASMVNGTW